MWRASTQRRPCPAAHGGTWREALSITEVAGNDVGREVFSRHTIVFFGTECGALVGPDVSRLSIVRHPRIVCQGAATFGHAGWMNRFHGTLKVRRRIGSRKGRRRA